MIIDKRFCDYINRSQIPPRDGTNFHNKERRLPKEYWCLTITTVLTYTMIGTFFDLIFVNVDELSRIVLFFLQFDTPFLSSPKQILPLLKFSPLPQDLAKVTPLRSLRVSILEKV